MIPSEQRHVCRILGFQQQEHCEHLQAIIPSVHKIAQEDVACIWYLASGVEKLKEIVKLSMYVATHLQHPLSESASWPDSQLSLPTSPRSQPIANVYSPCRRTKWPRITLDIALLHVRKIKSCR